MTQIISVITKEYALLASDRRLTHGEGPRQGELFDDDSCKLVSLCNICGIGYAGLAHIEGSPTHEWIAKSLASANCNNHRDASRVLTERAGHALSIIHSSIRRQVFLMAGWGYFDDPPALRTHFCMITNSLDASGQLLADPNESFDTRVRSLRDDEEFLWTAIGQPLQNERAKILEKNIRRLIAREIGPKQALRLIVDEIIHTSEKERCSTVGNKVLGFSIPKRAVENQFRTGHSMMLAKQPDETSVAFTYFESGYSELRQFGPTFICGEFAATDIETENDPTRDYQSSQMRLLSLPKRET